MNNYHDKLDILKDIYLEDSFVIEIKEKDNYIKFLVELVLTEEHELFDTPGEDEQYCYKKASMIFKNIESLVWLEKKDYINSSMQVSGDMGNIDIFKVKGNEFMLYGDWGKVKITSSDPIIMWS